MAFAPSFAFFVPADYAVERNEEHTIAVFALRISKLNMPQSQDLFNISHTN
jgi:hypothetical protein